MGAAGWIAPALIGASGLGTAAAWGLARGLINRTPSTGALDAYITVRRLIDSATMETRQGGLSQVFIVLGTTETTLGPDEQEALARRRAQALVPLLEAGCVVRLHAVRNPTAIHEDARFPHPFLTRLHETWLRRFADVYDCARYLAIEAPSSLARWRFNDLVNNSREALAPFRPRRLEGGELIRWLGDRLDPLLGGVEAATVGELSAVLAPARISCDRRTGRVTVRSGGQVCHGHQITVREWTESDAPALVDGLLELPVRMEITFTLRPIPRSLAMIWVEQRRRQQTTEGDNELINKEFKALSDQVQAGRDTIVRTQLAITVYGDDDTIETATEQVRTYLTSTGIKAITEDRAAPYLWLSRLPGNPLMVRDRPLKVGNVGRLWRWGAHPEGHGRSDWGPGALRLFPTLSGAAYRLQLHVSDRSQENGNFMLFAPPGVGKTTAMLHIIGGAARHPDLRIFIFDRNLSTRVWAEAVGAAYVNPHDTSQVKLNPFQGPDTKEERDFVHSFLILLSGRTDPESQLLIATAVRDIFALPPAKRSLTAVWRSAFPPGPLKDALKRWADKKDIGGLINADRDSLALGGSRIVVFDMTQLVHDPVQAAVIVTYVLHRIRQMSVAEASPHLVYLEEVAPMIEHVPVFAAGVKVLLREHRKLRGVVGLVFQEPGAAFKGPIGETLLTNCPRSFVFPNPRAQADDYAPLNLNDDMWQFVKDTHTANRRLKRPCLTITPDEAVYLDFDLGALGNLLRFYQGGSEPVARMLNLKHLYGDSWATHFELD